MSVASANYYTQALQYVQAEPFTFEPQTTYRESDVKRQAWALFGYQLILRSFRVESAIR